jgi:hypothetical protein
MAGAYLERLLFYFTAKITKPFGNVHGKLDEIGLC